MLALPFSEIDRIFRTLGYMYMYNLTMLNVCSSFDNMKIWILTKHLTKYFRILITPSLFYPTLKRVFLHIYFLFFRVLFLPPFKTLISPKQAIDLSICLHISQAGILKVSIILNKNTLSCVNSGVDLVLRKPLAKIKI